MYAQEFKKSRGFGRPSDLAAVVMLFYMLPRRHVVDERLPVVHRSSPLGPKEGRALYGPRAASFLTGDRRSG